MHRKVPCSQLRFQLHSSRVFDLLVKISPGSCYFLVPLVRMRPLPSTAMICMSNVWLNVESSIYYEYAKRQEIYDIPMLSLPEPAQVESLSNDPVAADEMLACPQHNLKRKRDDSLAEMQ